MEARKVYIRHFGEDYQTEYKEVIKALWINGIKTKAPICSNCRSEALEVELSTGGAYVMPPYCPFCGAEMERE